MSVNSGRVSGALDRGLGGFSGGWLRCCVARKHVISRFICKLQACVSCLFLNWTKFFDPLAHAIGGDQVSTMLLVHS